jgi:hypothetical protein
MAKLPSIEKARVHSGDESLKKLRLYLILKKELESISFLFY